MSFRWERLAHALTFTAMISGMSRRRGRVCSGCAVLVLVAAIFGLQSSGPKYDGRTVEEWLRRYDEMRNKGFYDAIRPVPPGQRQPVSSNELAVAEAAFRAMGTNAVPYLANCINRDQSYSRMELLRIKVRWRLPQRLKGLLSLRSKGTEANSAANLLADQIKLPGEMLIPRIEPALQSTNADQRLTALIAIRGITSGHELARPYLANGLADSNSQVQKVAAGTIRWFGPHGKWAVSNLLEAANSTNLDTLEAALHGLNTLGTNSWPVLPALKEMLQRETDEQRRKIIAHAISYISESTDSRDAQR